MKRKLLTLTSMICCALPIVASIPPESNKATTFPDVNKYYRLRSGNNNYLTMISNNDASVGLRPERNKDESNAAQIWSFTATADGKYHITSQHRCLKAPLAPLQNKGQKIGVTDENNTEAGSYVVTVFQGTKYTIGLTTNAVQDKIHDTNTGDIVGWGKWPAGSQWEFEPVTSINIQVTAAGYATINYPFAVQLPQGNIKAYSGKVAKANAADVFVLQEIVSRTIPANTPVILAGDANTYSLSILDKTDPATNQQISTPNPLNGSYMPKIIATGTPVFILSQPQTKPVGFYKLIDNGNNTDRKLGANKAYLPGSSISAVAANTLGFAFSLDGNGGGTTGIEETTTDVSNEEFYDLQGRRVLHPTKGIFVTKSGKKVLFMN